MIANCVFAWLQSLGGVFHSPAGLTQDVIGQFRRSLVSWKMPPDLTGRLSLAFNASIAFVTGVRRPALISDHDPVDRRIWSDHLDRGVRPASRSRDRRPAASRLVRVQALPASANAV